MAKANNTAIEQLIKWYEENHIEVDEAYPSILHKMQDLRAGEEKRQIEKAFSTGARQPSGYQSADHYYFINYVDND